MCTLFCLVLLRSFHFVFVDLCVGVGVVCVYVCVCARVCVCGVCVCVLTRTVDIAVGQWRKGNKSTLDYSQHCLLICQPFFFFFVPF